MTFSVSRRGYHFIMVRSIALLGTLTIAVMVIACAVIVGLAMGSVLIVCVGVDALAVIGVSCVHALARLL